MSGSCSTTGARCSSSHPRIASAGARGRAGSRQPSSPTRARPAPSAGARSRGQASSTRSPSPRACSRPWSSARAAASMPSTITAAPVPKRVWAMVVRSARGKRQLESAVAGREQSVHLEHEMMLDWDEPLLPRAQAATPLMHLPRRGADRRVQARGSPRLCGRGRHRSRSVAASALARLRRVSGRRGRRRELPPCRRRATRGGRGVAPPRTARALPAGAVLKRLGRSGMQHGGEDLEIVLQRAYAAFAAR